MKARPPIKRKVSNSGRVRYTQEEISLTKKAGMTGIIIPTPMHMTTMDKGTKVSLTIILHILTTNSM
jgi:hypothetical protein